MHYIFPLNINKAEIAYCREVTFGRVFVHEGYRATLQLLRLSARYAL